MYYRLKKNLRLVAYFAVIVFITAIFILFPFPFKIKRGQWKHSDGYSAGDWIEFDTSNYYKIKNNTIYKKDSFIATVLIVSFGRMIIKNPDTNEKGYYVDKSY
jgi:hypothetical protein